MFTYPCPVCGTENNLHIESCKFTGIDRTEYESAYIDIISWLSLSTMRLSTLKSQIEDSGQNWSEIHRECLLELSDRNRVQIDEDGFYRLISKKEREDLLEPSTEPLATIWEYGTVPGCHDNGLFSLIAYFAHQDLSWEATKEKIQDWYQRTKSWERGGFEESSIEELIESKKHVWEEQYYWSSHARQAKRVIENHRKGLAKPQYPARTEQSSSA